MKKSADQGNRWAKSLADKLVLEYRKAADRGNVKAYVDLGYMYENGLGVLQDYKQAFYWDQKAAEGSTGCTKQSWCLYLKVLGIPRNYNKAFAYYQQAAKQGYAIAQNDLGIMYENGLGVVQDYKQAAD